jgi:hypothetical protein
MQSKSLTVKEYLAQLPPDRRKAIETVRKVIKKNLPKGYKEVMQYGMIGYVVPLSVYPAGYLGKPDVPLPYACIASQKNHMAVYLMNIYGTGSDEKWFKAAYKASGKKMDVGKSCVRFKKLEDLPLDLIGQAVARTPVKETIIRYERARAK